MAEPDTANPDTANPDTANPDTANPDTANPDTANRDDPDHAHGAGPRTEHRPGHPRPGRRTSETAPHGAAR